MTLNEIAYSIKNRLEGFIPSDDSVLDIEYIYSRINVARSNLVMTLEKNKISIDDSFYQKICCLKIECESTVCGGMELSNSYYVELPDRININHTIKYFGDVDLSQSFTLVSNTGFIFNHASQFSKNIPYYTLIGNKAYVKNLPTSDMEYMCMVAILNNPLDGKCIRSSADDQYPLPQIYVQDIEQMVINELMPSMMVFPDNANDASSDARVNKLNYTVTPLKRNK